VKPTLRLAALCVLGVLLTLTLIARVGWLTLVRGDQLADRAWESRLRVEISPAPRGRILDRHGRVLAEDRLAYQVAVRLIDLDRGPAIAQQVARWIRAPRAHIEANWDELVRGATAAPDGAPLLLQAPPSEASARMFRRLCKREPGLRTHKGSLFVERWLLLQPARVVRDVAGEVGADPAVALARVERARRRALMISNRLDRQQALGTPVVLHGPIPFEVAALVEERLPALPGVVLERARVRVYPFGDAAPHVVGHLGAITPKEAKALRQEGRLLNVHQGARRLDGVIAALEQGRFFDDRVGRLGAESAFQRELEGLPGVRWVERNKQTGTFDVLVEASPEPGKDVQLSIELGIQEAIELKLDDQVARTGARGGAAVLIDATTGEVLALASSPRFDPNRIRTDYAGWLGDSRTPLLHRGIAAALPPGSTVKPLTAAALLSEPGARLDGRPATASAQVFCRGFLHTWNRFKCDGIHGKVDVVRGLCRSCNVYFYLAGEALGEAGLTRWFGAFGLGRATGLELGEESRGLMPSAAGKAQRLERARLRAREAEAASLRAQAELAALALFGAGSGPGAAAGGPRWQRALAAAALAQQRVIRARATVRRLAPESGWRKGDSRNTAIGQGELLATPIQIARATAAIATGSLPTLTLRAGRGTGPGAMPLPIEANTLSVLQRGMRETVRQGTARREKLVKHADLDQDALRRFERVASAKTGTAEAPGGRHAWITGYAPLAENPERKVAFCVLLENVEEGIHGGDGAGPIAVDLVDLAHRHLLPSSSEPAR
jgi:penicillin-binding protein 2